MRQNLKIALAPLWVPIIPSAISFVLLKIVNATVYSVYQLNTNLPEPWGIAQDSMKAQIPDPLIMSITIYLFCIPIVYLLIDKAPTEKAIKETTATKGDLK
jgi:hypothetical protein